MENPSLNPQADSFFARFRGAFYVFVHGERHHQYVLLPGGMPGLDFHNNDGWDSADSVSVYVRISVALRVTILDKAHFITATVTPTVTGRYTGETLEP